jgi:PrgI family protein
MTPPDPETAARARMPADVDAPDKVLYGLTFRQLAILAVAAVVFAAGWHLLHQSVPAAVLVFVAVPLGGVVFAIAVGRRDGLPLDVWLTHAVRYQRAPRALSTADTATTLPPWVTPPADRVPLPAPLRLPAQAIDDDGTIALTDTTRSAGDRAAIVAATTVNLTLRTPAEQAALLDTFGRWLNSLTQPTQIVIANQPVDLQSAADTLTTRAAHLPNALLAAACADHAAFLTQLAHRRDPLRRQVLIATRSSGPDPHAARRHADDTARTLTALGVTARTLDGAAATTAIAACADPYRPPRPGGQAPPTATITGPPAGIWRTTQ